MKQSVVRISEKHKVMVIPHDQRVANLIPHAKPHERNGHKFLLIPHKPQESKLLSNLGYTPPAPILSQYDWAKTKPFASQRQTAAMLTSSKRAYVLSSMGVGKTLASLYAADYLMNTGVVKRAIVVAPLSTLSPVWDAEIFRRMPHRSAVVVHGPKAKRIKLLTEDADFYIINHDGLGTVEKELAKRDDINLVIIDELAAYRTSRTARWKVANRLFKNKEWMWGLTGSPTPNAPTDAFGQIKLITPERAPRYFKAFQAETMTQITQFKWIPKTTANDTVYEYMQPSVRYTRDQCFDLPPVMYTTREVEMDPKQDKAYKEIMRHLAMRWAEGEVTAVNEGVKMSKLLQIGSGYVYTTDKKTIDVGAKKRLAELRSLIDGAEGKVIVFMAFKHTVDQVFEHLEPDYDVEKVYGDTSKTERDAIFNRFQFGGSPRVLVAHPQCMSHGLTLTEANTIIWYTPITSNEVYEQACARITRAGQKRKQFIVHIEQSPVERRVFSRLKNKQKVQGLLLNMFKEQTSANS